MTRVVVLGAGYAGAGTVQALEDELDDGVDLVWISEHDYHLVLHESHRVVRDPDVAEKVTIPVDVIKGPETSFREATVVGVDTDERTVALAEGEAVDYDYLVVCLGSRTAFFGIEGLEEHAHTLKSLDDARGIHEAVTDAAAAATRQDPVRVVIGGAGLSGIQVAGEIAQLREDRRLPVEVHLVEGLAEVLPTGDPPLQATLRAELEARDVTIHCGEFVAEIDEDTVYVGEDRHLDYDVLVWTGGIAGQRVATSVGVARNERDDRLEAGADFQTSDDRVFAVGDAAHVAQDGDEAPPTAQAAWSASEVIAHNVAARMDGRPLEEWTYEDLGTLVSVGETAVAHDVVLPPGLSVPVRTFDSYPAEFLKKAAAARWIARVSTLRRALDAWSVL